MSDDFELISDLIGQMVEREELLRRGLDDAQRSLTYNDYAMVLTPGMFHAGLVLGRILLPEEAEIVRWANQVGAADQDHHEQGFRYGIWHSQVAATGFSGWIHFSRLYPITEQEYLSAREHGFDPEVIGQHAWFQAVTTAILEAVEKLPSAPRRSRCLRCGSHKTMLRSYYSGVIDQVAALREGVVRMGPILKDEMRDVSRRCMVCEECGYESPDVSKESGWTFEDVQQPGCTALETVWDYGPELPIADWG